MTEEELDQLVDYELIDSTKKESPELWFGVHSILSSLRFFKKFAAEEGIPIDAITREMVIERMLKKTVSPEHVREARKRVVKKLKQYEKTMSKLSD